MSVTDGQIRKLRWHALWDTELADRAVQELCDVALGTRCSVDAEAYREARARCAELIAARAAKKVEK